LRERLRSPTLREIAIGVAIPLVGGLIAFGAREVWGLIYTPAPTGAIEEQPETVDAFVSRDDFYRRFVHEPAPPPPVSTIGVVFGMQTSAEDASSCGFVYTARNVTTDTTVGDLVDQPIPDVAGSGCVGQKRVWIPWPCVPSDSEVEFEVALVAGSKQLDSATTKKFLIGGSC